MSSGAKTVFVLGAGFSRFAGFPLQAEILDRVPTLSLMDAPRDTIDIYSRTLEAFRAFQSSVFSESKPPVLEDVFTLLDQTIARREHCGGFSWEELEEIREAYKRAILFAIHSASEEVPLDSLKFYDQLAAHLADRRTADGQQSDPFSVVSLNWDCLLEDSVYRFVRAAKLVGQVDIDYCCYTDPLNEECPHTPSVVQRARGLYNVKFLKLHGSTNWLRCPNCNRLFTGIGSEAGVWSQYVNPQPCSACPSSGRSPIELEPFFITPTFVKVFDNSHIQSIWHNAYVELTEANEVVFLGYSLPAADYHVRTLLRRAIQRGTKLIAVLARNDEPKRNTPRYLRASLAGPRYRDFFGEDNVEVHSAGIESYFADLVSGVDLAKMQSRIRRRLRDRAGA